MCYLGNNFDAFLNDSNQNMDEIEKLNGVGQVYNIKQRNFTNKQYEKIAKIPSTSNYHSEIDKYMNNVRNLQD